MPTVSLIVAASANNVIGVAGDLPWRLSDDLKNFRRLTTGKPVIMGRRTWDSIGRPLPDRHNIVVTRNAEYAATDCTVVASPAAALAAAGDAEEIMIIGGGQIYDLFLDKASRVYLTRVDCVVDNGDAFFPQLGADWLRVRSDSHAASARNEFAFELQVYDRSGGD